MKKFTLSLCLWLAMALPAFAIDSTQLFNENVLGTKIEKASSGGVPVGTIIAWPVSSNPEDPENWLECNGQAISQSVYPELFAVVGGGNVPDFRGLFLRGVGGGSAPLGVYQSDEMKAHSHSIGATWGWSGSMSGAITAGSASPAGNKYTNEAGGSENRPTNKAVRYFIRATP